MLGTVRLLILRVNDLQGSRRLMPWAWINVSDGKCRNTVSSRDSLDTLFYCLGLGLGLEGYCLGLGLEGYCLGLDLGLEGYSLGHITDYLYLNFYASNTSVDLYSG